MKSLPKVVVIGAGIGGLTTAALLARAGIPVTVLEAHVYPGGCAGTFFHQGYRFDAGATLAGGFYPGGPMNKLAQALTIPQWPAMDADIAMDVHLPAHLRAGMEGSPAVRFYGDTRRWTERERAFGPDSFPFWRWQEATADRFWDLALRTPPWPAQTISEGLRLGRKGLSWLIHDPISVLRPGLIADAFRPVAARLPLSNERLRVVIDGQLLIAAQTTSRYANALYAASALDLPRRGIVHFQRGIGTLAETLAEAVRAHGGRVLMRHQVTRILHTNGRITGVETKRKESFDADLVIGNLTPWNLVELWGEEAPGKLAQLPPQPTTGWGAFMVYAGVDDSIFPANTPLHHQIITQEPLGEGNSIFISISPPEDASRAPAGYRAVTISTHTAMNPWWTLRNTSRDRYAERRDAYTKRILHATEQAFPGFREAAALTLPGTPITFNRFTRRVLGWVGGFPQTSLLNARGPRINSQLWMVGDSIFPGQSTAAVALGGMRVAESILGELGIPVPTTETPERARAAAYPLGREPV